MSRRFSSSRKGEAPTRYLRQREPTQRTGSAEPPCRDVCARRDRGLGRRSPPLRYRTNGSSLSPASTRWRRPITPGSRLQICERVRYARLLCQLIEARWAQLPPPVEDHNLPRVLRLDTVGNRIAPLAFVAVLAAGRHHDTSRSCMPTSWAPAAKCTITPSGFAVASNGVPYRHAAPTVATTANA